MHRALRPSSWLRGHGAPRRRAAAGRAAPHPAPALPPARAALSSSAQAGRLPPQQQQQPQQPQQQRRGLGWAETHKAATVAAWSGWCYLLEPSDLEARLAAAGASLVASGRNDFTSWYVADATIDPMPFARRALGRRGAGGGSSNGGSGAETDGSGGNSPAGSTDGPGLWLPPPPPAPRRERFVMLRGVQWAAPELDTAKVWRSLMRVWPRPLAANPDVVVHDGVAELAMAMWGQLRPYLDHADDAGIPIVFAGHSLGGALSKVLLALHRLHSRRPGGDPQPSCFTFGSPPVMAHVRGGGGDRVLDLLGLPPPACRNFILQNDPVPRALLSVDPTYQLLAGLAPVKGLLQLRAWLAGHGGAPVSPERFLFETVGEVHFIRWTPQDGSQVVLLEPGELAAELSMLSTPPSAPASPATAPASPLSSADGGAGGAAGTGGGGLAAAAVALGSPLRAAQAVLDHHHGSYQQELEAAAVRELMALARAAAPAAAPATGARPMPPAPAPTGPRAGPLSSR